MRTFNKFLAVVIFLASSSLPAHADSIPEQFTFTGSGYGHGVGMSQIGAKAKALAGESATAILNYYYKDVTVAPWVDTQTIRVNIGHALKSATFSAPSGSTITYFAGESTTGVAQTSLGKQKLNLSVAGNWAILGGIKAQRFTITWSNTISLTQNGSTSTYKYGFISVKVVKGSLEITTSLRLHDEYLWGISEVSSAWPAAALEAQVIASRSYAASKLGPISTSCDCNVYSHISDQNFVGYSKESEPRIGKLWREAVIRTNIDTFTSLAILQNGKPVQAYYSSSSGGATQTTLDAWGTPTAYTQSVVDSASVDVVLNPRFALWRASSSQALVAAAFGLPDVISLEVITRNQAGAVTSIKGTSSTGGTKILRGDTFRSRAKLPSAWFSLAN